MSPKRAPSKPPELAGFEYAQLLGSGGFADVFLYDQELPRRRVAVKVLLSDKLGANSQAEFTAEANLMAQLSTHPSIVTIYQAGVALDGRPYLVMEYCSRPNLQVRYRKEKFSVAEALRIGVQVAGAVETAHRAGILHRDIKPANILVTQYNRPALTDFGISATTTDGETAEAVGMSIPWSPPESFAANPASVAQSDVYALAATVYTLLAGRSPFELPGASNTGMDLVGRIQAATLTPIARPDVPASLEAALAKAMAKNIGARFATALDFGRALQRVQIELSHSVTTIDVLDDSLDDEREVDEEDGLTRVKGIVSIDPAPAPQRPSAAVTGLPEFGQADHTIRRGDAQPFLAPVPDAPALDATVRREPLLEVSTDAAARRPRRALVPVIIAAAAVLLVGGVIAAVVASGAGSTQQQVAPEESDAPVDVVVGAAVPAPEGLAGVATADGVQFSWQNPDPEDGDVYLWNTVQAGVEPAVAVVDDAAVTVAATGAQTCLQVSIRRADGRASGEPAVACVP